MAATETLGSKTDETEYLHPRRSSPQLKPARLARWKGPLMLLMLATLASAAAPSLWVEFDRRPSGWAESAFEYDAASLRRNGARIRASYRYTIFTSGVPDYHARIGIEIDCARSRARITRNHLYGGIHQLARREPRRLPTPNIATRIAPGSVEAALAGRLCPNQETGS